MNPAWDHSATPSQVNLNQLQLVISQGAKRDHKQRLIQLLRYLASLCPHKTSLGSTRETASDCCYVIKLALKLK